MFFYHRFFKNKKLLLKTNLCFFEPPLPKKQFFRIKVEKKETRLKKKKPLKKTLKKKLV